MVEVAENSVETVHGGQVLIKVAEMVLAELAGRYSQAASAVQGWSDSSLDSPSFAPGRPTCEARSDRRLAGDGTPARRQCNSVGSYQSVNSAPSFAMRSMLGVLVAHHPLVIGADVPEGRCPSPQMMRMFGFLSAA